jgi:hypothetical protein
MQDASQRQITSDYRLRPASQSIALYPAFIRRVVPVTPP